MYTQILQKRLWHKAADKNNKEMSRLLENVDFMTRLI